MGDREWAGNKLDLDIWIELLKLKGTRLGGQRCSKYSQTEEAGTPIRYLVEVEGKFHEVTVPISILI